MKNLFLALLLLRVWWVPVGVKPGYCDHLDSGIYIKTTLCRVFTVRMDSGKLVRVPESAIITHTWEERP